MAKGKLLKTMMISNLPAPTASSIFSATNGFPGCEILCPSRKVLVHIPPVPGMTAQFQPESGNGWASFVAGGDVLLPEALCVNRDHKPSDPES